MGTYHRVLESERSCPHCGDLVRRPVQFHYGDTRPMDLYEFGEVVRGVEPPDADSVVLVGGWPEACPACGRDFEPDEEILAVEITSGAVTATKDADEGLRARFLMDEVVRLR